MQSEGPLLESLTRHLAECPPDFLAEPRQPGGQGKVEVAAVVSDLLEELNGAPLTLAQAAPFRYPSQKEVAGQRNRLRLILVGAWLFFARDLKAIGPVPELVRRWLAEDLGALAGLVQAPDLVQDPDRREEFVRLGLQALSLRPAGESREEAEDRLTTLSSLERVRVVRQSQEAEERARKVREELARKAAEAAASTYGSE